MIVNSIDCTVPGIGEKIFTFDFNDLFLLTAINCPSVTLSPGLTRGSHSPDSSRYRGITTDEGKNPFTVFLYAFFLTP